MRTLIVITRFKSDAYLARSEGYKGQTSCTNSAKIAALRHASKILDAAEDDLEALEDPAASGRFLVTKVNLLIGEITAMIDGGERPGGLVAAIVTNDLRGVIAHREFTDWKLIEEAVRHIYSHVPTYKVDVWKKKLKGGA